MSRLWLRWLPAAVAPAVIAAGVMAGSIPARAGDPLPEKTPAQVLALLGGHKSQTFSGTVEQSSELGLPELPAMGPTSGPASGGGPASLIEWLTGGHTARVYMAGKEKVRIQVVDRLAERDVIRRDNDVWFYSSKDNSAAHMRLPAVAHDLPLPEHPLAEPAPDTPGPPTLEEIAEHFLAKVDPTTAVSVGDDVEVAGRAAYNLTLEPRTQATLVGKVEVAVDGETGMPLSVEVTPRGLDTTAFRAAFTKLSLEAPDDALFTFVPPPGSAMEELEFPNPPHWPAAVRDPGMKITPDQLFSSGDHPAHPTVTGKGWEAVAILPAAFSGGELADSLLRNPLLSQAAVVVPGGRLLSTTLFSVLLTDDGRILAGMVPPDRLQAAAAAVQ